jgi:hypothetical protein
MEQSIRAPFVPVDGEDRRQTRQQRWTVSTVKSKGSFTVDWTLLDAQL